MRDHRKLESFAHADELVADVYRLTTGFPKSETYGLLSQIRRAAVSVPANIVEGSARRSGPEYVQFLNQAFGSLRELGYLLDLSHRLEFLSDESFTFLEAKYEKTARMLSGLLRALS